MRKLTQHQTTDHRQGFTLIELMIVVVIIAALMGLILPAVRSAFNTAKITEVKAEMSGLESAIAQFKNVYGIEPPSRIRIYEAAAGSPSWASHTGTFTEPVTGQTVSHDSERVRSIALINRIWPNFVYGARDLNGDGDTDDFYSLTGAECLVFFLGGRVTGPAGGPYAVTGFSKNPADPLAAASGSESREGPFFEFKPSRLRASLNTANAGMLVYVDPSSGQNSPYVYASSYDGRGYQLPDLFAGSGDDLNDVYRTAPGVTSVAHKPKSFQLITPGVDGLYGAGGNFNEKATNHGLTSPVDYDNLTNFFSGPLNK